MEQGGGLLAVVVCNIEERHLSGQLGQNLCASDELKGMESEKGRKRTINQTKSNVKVDRDDGERRHRIHRPGTFNGNKRANRQVKGPLQSFGGDERCSNSSQ